VRSKPLLLSQTPFGARKKRGGGGKGRDPSARAQIPSPSFQREGEEGKEGKGYPHIRAMSSSIPSAIFPSLLTALVKGEEREKEGGEKGKEDSTFDSYSSSCTTLLSHLHAREGGEKKAAAMCTVFALRCGRDEVVPGKKRREGKKEKGERVARERPRPRCPLRASHSSLIVEKEEGERGESACPLYVSFKALAGKRKGGRRFSESYAVFGARRGEGKSVLFLPSLYLKGKKRPSLRRAKRRVCREPHYLSSPVGMLAERGEERGKGSAS